MAYRICVIGLVSAFGLLALSGCSSDDDASFDSDGGAGSSGTGGSSGSAGAAGSAGSGGGAGSTSVECNGSHPTEENGQRVCPVGQCRCQASDTCFPSDQAARCCEGEIRCFTNDGTVDCKGTHPVVTEDGRSCEAGSCYCEARDACFPSAIAALCCAEPPICK